MRRCKPSWIDTYIEYTSTQESPKSFHYWVGMSILSAAVGRHVSIPRIKYTTFPNIYVVLVAGSAKCRKSVAIGVGRDILVGIKDPPTIFAQKITTEALIQALNESKTNESCFGLIIASELSVFLGCDAIRSGIIPMLTDIYDSPRDWVYHTRARGKESLQNVTLTMLAASTKDWLRTSLPLESIGGGFTSRVIFVFEDTPSQLVLFSDQVVNNDHLKEILVHDLNLIQGLHGVVTFSKEAKEHAWHWYQEEASKVHDEKVDGYFGRKHDTMFKIATLLSISDGSTLVIEDKHIIRALELMERNEKYLNTVLESVVSTSFDGNTDKVFQIIRKFKNISHTQLLQKCWRFCTATELAEMMRTLVDSGEIIEYLDKNNGKWYRRKE